MEDRPTTFNPLKAKIHDFMVLLASENARQGGEKELLTLSEKNVASLFRSTDVVTVSILEEGRFVYVNDAFLEVSGYTREEIAGRTSLELNLWVDPGQRGDLIRLLREKGSAEDMNIKLRTKNGEIHSAIRYIETCEFQGEQCIVSVVHDITSIRRVTESLRLERNRLKDVLDAMEDGVCIVNEEYDIEYANPSVIEGFGPFLGKKCHEYFNRDKDRCPACKINRIFTLDPVQWEWYSPLTRKTYDVLDIPMLDANGRKSKLEILHDSTSQKQAREALLFSEERYRTLVETMPDGLVQGENDGIIKYVNHRLCEMLGYEREEMVGRQLVGFLNRESQEAFSELVDKTRRGNSESLEMNWVRKDGVTVSTSASPKAILDEDGRIKGCFAVIHDITERKRAEEELRKSYERVRSLGAHLQTIRETERTRIAREIHDELGQVLTALKMDLCWAGGKLRKDQQELQEKANAMIGLVGDAIRSVKRICAELRPGVLDDLGLTAALEWQAAEFRKRSKIPCTLAVQPPGVQLNREQSTALFRVFQEALTNVSRHAEATNVAARLEEDNGEVVLTVADDGKGITKPQIASQTSFGIMGIKERIDQLGGTVAITGSPGQGTTIRVSIPRADTDVNLSGAFAGKAPSDDPGAPS
jgi:PAS domain S-box-containing protein